MDKTRMAAAAAKGDETAFIQLMDAERQRMYRIAAAYLQREADIVEAVQETVCRAWLKRRHLRKPEFMTTWLVRILIRVCSDELARRKRMDATGSIHEQLEQDGASGWPDEASEVDSRLDMDEAVRRLDQPYRDVIVLKYREDMTLTEIAGILGKPDGTVKTWLHKALKMLRAALAAAEKGKEETSNGS
ncbi:MULTISPECIES: sigma-70 family RNA polymerase sigma factor [unclassified Paenibacillus]|uniref:sigma-70 family RNA polymerase sigma factor n=1 Tax=unclassified Paenibacillus TaxID=185978 RepID=UPI0009540844|nr:MULTISPECIES: sigma-70 family RNA polymerase sigma factor [unclassified Paenibacillus]ASS66891.1 sigma-70 family RNA polymerase sigma factor [Paenibacillus sp. RUD330]SIR52693.1 RNA polymerase sigma-70 factor, ECF subfamily [Paenibacillus sp. RU4X]SIR61583.1 RNA polymerase sigma-70 factor, ECF subfamily [Paenibacillus sp. RU4T]